LPVKGLQNLDLCCAGRSLYCATRAVTLGLHFSRFIQKTTPFNHLLGPLIASLSGEGFLSCHHCCDTGTQFFRFHPKDRLLRHAWGCGGPILTWILTGPHSVRWKCKATIHLFTRRTHKVRIDPPPPLV
jgi:hypothetical protein